jgi:hypothetical protein
MKEAICRRLGVQLLCVVEMDMLDQTLLNPVRTPHYGGHTERLIGTMMGKVHLLPGNDLLQRKR